MEVPNSMIIPKPSLYTIDCFDPARQVIATNTEQEIIQALSESGNNEVANKLIWLSTYYRAVFTAGNVSATRLLTVEEEINSLKAEIVSLKNQLEFTK